MSKQNILRFIISGFSQPEPDGIWTDGKLAELAIPVARETSCVLDCHAFIEKRLPVQEIIVTTGARLVTQWKITEPAWQRLNFTLLKTDAVNGVARVTLKLPNATSPKSLGLGNDKRALALQIRDLWFDLAPVEYGRKVGGESRKSYDDKLRSGFWQKYITGPKVLDIGFKGALSDVLPIVDGAIGVDLDFPGYDGKTLPFPAESYDAIYTSHCLEHIPDPLYAIREWWRVVKIGGHIIIAVPHAFLYERRYRPPSRWNGDHLRVYTPSSLLMEVEKALPPNTYRVRHLMDNDALYNYSIPPDQHPSGSYEIELVLQKILPPAWSIAD